MYCYKKWESVSSTLLCCVPKEKDHFDSNANLQIKSLIPICSLQNLSWKLNAGILIVNIKSYNTIRDNHEEESCVMRHLTFMLRSVAFVAQTPFLRKRAGFSTHYNSIGKFITWRANSALNCTRKPISHESRKILLATHVSSITSCTGCCTAAIPR